MVEFPTIKTLESEDNHNAMFVKESTEFAIEDTQQTPEWRTFILVVFMSNTETNLNLSLVPV